MIALHDVTVHHHFVAHAIGSDHRPHSDAMLDEKFHGLCDGVLGAARAKTVAEAARKIGDAANLQSLVALCRP